MSYWVFLAVSLLACSVGFYKYIWFFSVGYGFAIAAIGVALPIAFHGVMGVPEWLMCILLVMYGARLGGYLMTRELKSASYRKTVAPELARKMPFGAQVALWISCGLLYTLMTSPIFHRLQNGAQANAWLWIGLPFMIGGILLEIIVDMQKSAAKKKNSGRFVDTGLYRFVRCPNYLGELLLWLGVFISGIGALQGIGQWVMAVLGLLLIAWVMFSGARRLEIRQDRNYGNDPEYQKYISTVPVIIPFIPLYSVKKYKFQVA